MAYNQDVAARIRAQLDAMQPYTEKSMFGGTAFFVNGNMACGVIGDSLMVRVGPERYREALEQTHVRPFDMTGRSMKGWVEVQPAGHASDESLADWIRQGVEFASTLPAK